MCRWLKRNQLLAINSYVYALGQWQTRMSNITVTARFRNEDIYYWIYKELNDLRSISIIRQIELRKQNVALPANQCLIKFHPLKANAFRRETYLDMWRRIDRDVGIEMFGQSDEMVQK